MQVSEGENGPATWLTRLSVCACGGGGLKRVEPASCCAASWCVVQSLKKPLCGFPNHLQVALLDSPTNRRLLGTHTPRRMLLQGYKTVTAGLYSVRVTLSPAITPTQTSDLMTTLQKSMAGSAGPTTTPPGPSGPRPVVPPGPSPMVPSGPGLTLPTTIKPPGLPMGLPPLPGANATATAAANATGEEYCYCYMVQAGAMNTCERS
jgi:hypothetical protein